MGKTRDLALVSLGASLAPRESGPRHVTQTQTIHEHRAPTDESVKLLKEMEEQALAKLDETIRIEGNGFNGVIHLMRRDWGDELFARCVYTINGRKMTTDHAVGFSNARSAHERRQQLITELRDKVATDIAGQVLRVAFEASPAAMDAISGCL